MFAFTKQKDAESAESKPRASEFIEARSYYGMAIHVIPAEGGREREALCGYSQWTPTNTDTPVTSEIVIASIPNQHSGWFWCRSCAALLTGIPAAEFKLT